MTIPTSTSSLPTPEAYLTSPFSEAHDFSDQDDISVMSSPDFEVLTSSSRSSCSSLQSPPPLSPISPNSTELFPHVFGSPSVHPASTSPEIGLPHGIKGDGQPFLIDGPDDRLFSNPKLVKDEALGNYPALSLLRIQEPDHSDVSSRPFYVGRFCDSPGPIEARLDPIELDDNPFPPLPFSSHSNHPTQHDSFVKQAAHEDRFYKADQKQHQVEKQKDQPLALPATFHPTFSPSMRNSSLPELDDLCEMDVDFPDYLLNHPSPSRRSYTALPDDDHETLETPPPHPEVERETLNDTVMLSPPASPGLTMLSLPGADTDEDLISLDLASSKLISEPSSPLIPSRLLVMDDTSPASSSSRRSPSPEPCTTLDTSFIESQISGDEELKKVCGLMKKTKDKERATRQIESLVEEEEKVTRSITGGSNAATAAWDKLGEARRKTKKMKEKVREVATLLRLKLAERGWNLDKDASGNPILVPVLPTRPAGVTTSRIGVDASSPGPKGISQKCPRITNPQQLVVKMIMDRHEPKYNSNLRAGLPSRKKIISPLGRGAISATEVEPQDHEMSEEESIPNIVAIPDVSMDNVNGKDEDLMDELDLNMVSLGGP
ncbi:hypothetical protein AN958_09376 [Leucoagaricus sp. SymC.cos]|nr:hypothetical protein AN958_09376 [Leucoagaricus sp. SymC.cos]